MRGYRDFFFIGFRKPEELISVSEYESNIGFLF